MNNSDNYYKIKILRLMCARRGLRLLSQFSFIIVHGSFSSHRRQTDTQTKGNFDFLIQITLIWKITYEVPILQKLLIPHI